MLIVPNSVYPDHWTWKHRYGHRFCQSIVHRFVDDGGTNLDITEFSQGCPNDNPTVFRQSPHVMINPQKKTYTVEYS